SAPEVIAPQQPPLTPRRVAALVLCRAEHQDIDDALLIKRLQSQHGELATAITLTQDFAQIVRERLPALTGLLDTACSPQLAIVFCQLCSRFGR
ncbi:MAG: hypothetical protein ACRDEA_03575, partial [Microcystaceae cyanobacterium]